MKSPNKNQDFSDNVFKIVRLIPTGRVTNYGAIARALGTAKSSRLVGWVLKSASSQTPSVPAHRVVNRNGLLTGKNAFATPTLMQELLEKEGIKITENKVEDFKNIFWDPMEIEIAD